MNSPQTTDALAFFATDRVVAALEADWVSAKQEDRLGVQLALAWQLRQRDTQRCLVLAQEALSLLGHGNQAHAAIQGTRLARITLIQAEAAWLYCNLQESSAQVESALASFAEHGDALGCADCYWLQAWIANDRGDSTRRDIALQAMCDASEGLDPIRTTIAQATLARFAAFADVVRAKERWGTFFKNPSAEQHPAATCAIQDFLGILLSNLNSDYAQSIRHHINTYDLALASGQYMRAIITATNLGEAFNDLNDHHAAMDWMRKGLELARLNGWPASLGNALMQTAGTLRYLQHLDTAQAMLSEALGLLAPLESARAYAVALRYLGDVEYDLQQYARALDAFQRLEQRAHALGQSDLLSHALLGQARVHLQLDQAQPALGQAHAALQAATHWPNYQISALRVLANIHTLHPALPHPPTLQAASAPLHYLLHALELAASIEKFTVPGDLLEETAKAYAQLGRMDRAYALSLQANAAREKTHSAQAMSRANAMQVTHETERVRAEAEHHRQLALAHAERADTLMQAKATLEQLGEIGREITGSLDADAIYSALNRHVHALLDVTTFAIDRLEPDGDTLKTVFGVEAGHALPPYQYAVDDAFAQAARCARERVEIVIDTQPGGGALVPGTLDTLSSMFVPLQVGERLLGVMTVQSVRPRAYAERDIAIFRTLCAYVAIALANNEAQARLVQSQKLASLGRLVAGVSHAMNTPLGTGLMAVSTLRDSLREIQHACATSGLKRQSFDAFLVAVDEGTQLAMRSLDRSASLVNSFKQIAVDRTTAARRVFLLAEVLGSVSAQIQPRLNQAGCHLTIRAPETVLLDSFADALAETLMRLLDNALTHGLAGKDQGEIVVDCQWVDPDHLRITVQDDGCGIALHDQPKVFDPFFTTRMGQFSGLGLHIAHNHVTQLLMGTLTLRSSPGAGCVFELVLPRTAPQAVAIA